ncbi:hypothetical protein B0T19DRAFT_351483 [Cercophora scortea]|uniref:Uncharacterized protein n=1 Tax=Cercophora scortea TaxID=314031 RepID=A0AAE0MN53_9PEZI|nr:hypothetical protein B0T19DRAFT_351483 [Cercophora scortea]
MNPSRPECLDLRSKSQASVSRPLRSPRLHVAGEAPPELSPLDAFAMQSRLLAKQLEESARQDHRVSRLPPLTTESPLIKQGRSEYFRSLSHDSGDEDIDGSAQHATGLGFRPEVEEDVTNRPVSMHPRMSGMPAPTLDFSIPLPTMAKADATNKGWLKDIDTENYFGTGARREQSPAQMDRNPLPDRMAFPDHRPESRSARVEGPPQQSPVPSYVTMAASPERIHTKSAFDAGGLVPPRPLFSKRSSSVMSSNLESTDEDVASSLGTSFHSQGNRKLSTSSGVLSPGPGPYQRSPSVSSESSGLPRPSFNFSRPLSRAGTPSFDLPARQASSDSHASFILADDTAGTPVSMNGEGFPDTVGPDGQPTAPTFVYSKFSLPRGKSLQRESAVLDSQPNAHFSWEQPPIVPPSNVQTYPINGQPPPSPPTRPSSAASTRVLEEPVPRASLEPSKLSIEMSRQALQSSPVPSRPSTDAVSPARSRPSGDAASPARSQLSMDGVSPLEDRQRAQPFASRLRDASGGKSFVSTATSDSASTIKARSQNSFAPTMSDMSAEEHVTKAIALHEAGQLQQSTWHLRHASKQNHPTGMLLYALACRHGWGMRANQREGVAWLRKAMECAQLEIADDEDHVKEGKPVDAVERKTRKAQFALSIYELGVSHMNGWGIEQDKALALRCFEIAGSWGDLDALAEAGFCHAQGIGCKKNLKKSAKFYREAEAKGMNMIGNSWIHKSKYDDDGGKEEKKSKPRKGIFGRKSST